MKEASVTALHGRPNEDAITMLREWLREAEAGHITYIAMQGRGPGGKWRTASSSSDNCTEAAGMLMCLAMRQLGFKLG